MNLDRRLSKSDVSQMPAYTLGLMNAFLFAASRKGDVGMVELLLSHNVVQAQVGWRRAMGLRSRGGGQEKWAFPLCAFWCRAGGWAA